MGEHEGPSRLVLNGVLSSESSRSVLCPLNVERWSRAEERTTELIACIQPNAPSEERRNAVAHYVQRLIMKCFPCQVFTFGSVPLKTYLPDGDIDLSVFSNNPNLKDTWATLVRDILESEEKNESAEFCVKEVQYIHAEVKIIKCLVETIVVDISFNQLGGLCTLCFLEEVDHLINQNHLFKRSIILIKAWCYYESRILGAHHGLISTYALETLVLYIFHIFNNSFAGPLEVLYRFLEFFNSFDWDQFCVSLWGPIPICSLPDFTPYPPRKDCGELLLTSGFLEKCNAAYADFPTSQENHGQPFMSKHFNIIDPLRVNNNLGRSVSKGNFFRIRSAFAFGAKRLAKLLYCPQEDIVFEVNKFFANTWERHGSGVRHDAPTPSFQHLMPLNVDQSHGLIKHVSMPMKKKRNERSFGHESIVESVKNPCTYSIENPNHSLENATTKNENTDRSPRSLELDRNVNEYIQGKYLFARTRSSPELTETYSDTSSQGRPNKATGSVEQSHASSTKTQNNRRRINGESGSTSTQASISSIDDHGHVNSSEEWASVVGAQGMLQAEQDLVNMISSSVNNFGGQFPIPLNMSSTNLPLPFSPSMLASTGYARRNMATLMPENISFVDPTNLSFPQGMVQSLLPPYFYGIGGLSSKVEDPAEQVNGKCGEPVENVLGNVDSEFLHERDGKTSGQFVHDDGNMVCVTSNNKQPSTSKTSGFVQPSRHCAKSSSKGSCDGSSSKGPKITKDKRGMKSTMYGKGKHVFEPASTNVEDEGGNCNQADTTSNTEMGERSSVVYLPRHMLFGGYEATQTNGSNSFLPMDPQMALGPGSHHMSPDGSGSHPFAFYPTGPPVPYVTMLPFYNFPLDVNSSDAQSVSGTSTRDESCDKVEDDLKALNESSSEGRSIPEEPKDILNSDFLSHWHNLQYGRSCQNPRLVYPSPVILPLGYIQGGALGTNMNMFSQVTSYSPHLATFHPMSDHTLAADYQEMPRYRTGTGTYLPNHKASRDRHSSGTRRNNYNYDRNDHRGDREGNWNTTKSRAASRNHHNRNQTDKSSSRLYRQTSSTNVGMNPNRVSSNGHVVPTTPMVMFYQYDDNNSSSQGASPSEALEFESVDHPMGFMRSNKVAQHVMEGARARGTFEDHSFHTSSQRSSPNQSSSHHVQRRT